MRLFRAPDEEDPFEAFDARSAPAPPAQAPVRRDHADRPAPSILNGISILCSDPRSRIRVIMISYLIVVLILLTFIFPSHMKHLPLAFLMVVTSVLFSVAALLSARRRMLDREEALAVSRAPPAAVRRVVLPPG
eukprot:CAMPEP_0113695772 /NCGR_PEP_ID=MMETSP0038_2-20120614/21096_1 /TAXON_ID=2898 /ORGANISM="Cryptomonas paramecium" /LENGTH=133 /DNA_ID=CAMNT_0000618373 /DNA_START=44 /DNA_END=442 /DNA_ORIENTATION=+ /assembly_acc=CAM_ASM_000170